MAKYFLTWEVDMSKFPTDPKDIMVMNMKTLETIKQALKESEGCSTGLGLFYGRRQGICNR